MTETVEYRYNRDNGEWTSEWMSFDTLKREFFDSGHYDRAVNERGSMVTIEKRTVTDATEDVLSALLPKKR